MSRLLSALLLASLLAAPALAADPDPLRAVLQESKDKNRGVSVYVAGNTVGMVVTAVEGDYVIGRSQTTSRIVIRLDRIDGVAAMF
ncbi:MAG: hypothetical protein HGA75_16795 [Thiobacillus sp.]|nr:hypothetical protein [Thiobacillus sp.]